jgi:cold shock CspA family protein
MPRGLKAKTLTSITPGRDGSTFHIQVEDEAGKRALFELTSNQALQLADRLDNLLADEEEELFPRAATPEPLPAAQAGFGTVKWYNASKGFGFIIPDGADEALFVHRSVLVQAGLSELREGTRVRIRIGEGRKGPQVKTLELA